MFLGTSNIITNRRTWHIQPLANRLPEQSLYKKEHQYFAQGLLWGGNFHVCHITAPIEGDSEPLPLTLKDGKLIFTQLEPEYDTSCNLEILFTDKGLKIVDENYHCSKYVFYCGVNVGLNNTELPKSVNKCPEEE